MSEPQAVPSVSRATQPDSVHGSNTGGVLPQMLSEAATTRAQHLQVAAAGENVAEARKQRESRNTTSGTEEKDMAIMESLGQSKVREEEAETEELSDRSAKVAPAGFKGRRPSG
ncbi:hypothetical protein LTR17_026952 [Elasticomyces elasticus]|nr:hypothetical protein LTR17_026952 [Elasticomyces elasticus]